MKTKLFGIGKWLGLAVFVLAAGLCYSCGAGGQAVSLARAETSADAVETQVEETEAEEAAALVSDDLESTALEPVGTCFVHVCGAVVNPGVYELNEGQRVFEAVQLAGGFAGDAASDYLNLAEPVGDGMKIFVPDKEQVQEESAGGLPGSFGGIQGIGGVAGAGGTAGTKAASKVNINTASKEELMTLKGIGEARAEDIIQYRQQRGGFDTIEDIMEVSGIKNAAFQKIKDDITV